MKPSPRPRNRADTPIALPGVTPYTSAKGDGTELSTDFWTFVQTESHSVSRSTPGSSCSAVLRQSPRSEQPRLVHSGLWPVTLTNALRVLYPLSREEICVPPAAFWTCVTRWGACNYFLTVSTVVVTGLCPSRWQRGAPRPHVTHTGCSRRI